MRIADALGETLCNFNPTFYSGCAFWWEKLLTPERIWTLFPALIGTLVGGLVTFTVQSVLKRREQQLVFEERVISFVMIASGIKADAESIKLSLNQYRENSPPDVELWRVVHTLQFTPSVRPDFSMIQPLSRFRSRDLLQKAMFLCSEYTRLGDVIGEYNRLKRFYADNLEVWYKDGKTERLRSTERNLRIHVDFVQTVTAALSAEVDEVHNQIAKGSLAYFGNTKFLKLK